MLGRFDNNRQAGGVLNDDDVRKLLKDLGEKNIDSAMRVGSSEVNGFT